MTDQTTNRQPYTDEELLALMKKAAFGTPADRKEIFEAAARRGMLVTR